MTEQPASYQANQPGTYVLALSLPRRVRLEVGALGQVTLKRGVYLYVGSARGPGGLSARLRRHARPDHRVHWHIDYLRREARPLLALVSFGSGRLECAWARVLESFAANVASAKGFGASDCKCPSHLFFGGSEDGFSASVESLRQAIGAEKVWDRELFGSRSWQ